MSRYIGQGGTITLDAFYTDGAGDAVDPTTPRVSIIDALGATVVSNDTPTQLSTGHYEYDYTVGVSAPLGAWDAHWTGVINGSPVSAHDGFTVVAAGSLSFSSSSSFVTVADYEVAFQTTVTTGAEEAAVQFALDAACAEIRTYLSQDVDYVTDDVVVLDGTGHQTLLLPQLPVVSVNSVFIDKGEDTEEEVTDYVIGFGGVLNRRCGWPWGFGNVTVDYDHGYGAYEGIDLPADLKNAALNIARSVANPASVESLGGIVSESIGGYSYTRDLGASSSTGIDVSAYSRTLDRYQVKRIPVP